MPDIHVGLTSLLKVTHHHGEAHVTSQWKQPLTIFGIYWQGNVFTGRSKTETLGTSNKHASKEQLKNVSKQLVMKFMLQLHKLPKCLDWKKWE